MELEGDALAEFLDRACAGDSELRREVKQMLGDEIETGDFLKRSPVAEFRRRAGTDALTAGAKINHYIIESSLGRGGMGEVYLARDEQLQRRVAIKILPPEFSADPERVRRFEQEALTVSALNHPNIITIHEVGQIGPLRFIITEFIEGRTLRDYIRG
jgi:serine/threonine-protein kinase